MTKVRLAAILFALVGTPLCLAPTRADLFSYVAKPDAAFAWEKTRDIPAPEGVRIAELRLTSQVWQGITWSHRLHLVKPQTIKTPGLALMLITGSGEGLEELTLFAPLATKVGALLAILRDIPNQPLYDLGDRLSATPPSTGAAEGMVEDEIISNTFVKFLKTGDEDWPLLFPMTKAAVKAMDAIQQFAKSEWGEDITGFVVTGGSKRGWTTWLTAAVDPRVKAIAPAVYDNLNLPVQMRRQIESFGGYSEQIADYTTKGLPDLVQTEEGRRLGAMVDPYTYRDKITVPKLIILGSNDRYWPLDACNVYWDDLVGEKYLLRVPNAPHGLNDWERVLGTEAAWMLKAAGLIQFPKMSWTFEEEPEVLVLTVTMDRMPSGGGFWVATAPTRDFRDSKWTLRPPTSVGMGTASYRLPKPKEGFAAVFGEAEFPLDGGKYYLSTGVRIVGPRS